MRSALEIRETEGCSDRAIGKSMCQGWNLMFPVKTGRPFEVFDYTAFFFHKNPTILNTVGIKSLYVANPVPRAHYSLTTFSNVREHYGKSGPLNNHSERATYLCYIY